MYTDVDQMKPKKIDELRLKIRTHKPNLVAVCEVNTERQHNQTIQEYSITGYTLYSVNLCLSKARGNIIYLKDELSESVTEINTHILQIRLKKGDSLIFACCYRSPTENHQTKLTQTFLNFSVSCRIKNFHIAV